MFGNLLNFITGNPSQFAGWLIVSGLVVQAGFWTLSGMRRYWFEGRRRRVELARLELEIRAAQLRIQTEEQSKAAWNGVRKFTVEKKVEECADTFSFYLKPHDGKPLPGFKPGQYLTFQLALPGHSKPLIRCYSLSDAARSTHYRVTIKRCPPPVGSPHPPGLCSS